MKNEVLLMGGYGVVGAQVASLVRSHRPDLPLVIAGRDLEAATRASEAVGHARGLAVDLFAPDLASRVPDDLAAIVQLANDPDDVMLRIAIARGVPLLDVTRWTDRVHSALITAAATPPRAAIVLASSWMAGVTALVAKAAAAKLAAVNDIHISIFYGMDDKAGPNSVEYVDLLGQQLTSHVSGQSQRVPAMSDPRAVTFPNGRRAKTYRFDEPGQITLGAVTGAHNVASRITFGGGFSMAALVWLVRSGIWGLLSGARFTSLRRSMLYSPGPGAPHEIVIDVAGHDGGGAPRHARATIVDPEGQTHLTALGATLQLDHLLGANGLGPLPAGVHFPENHRDEHAALALLRSHGVDIKFDVTPI